MSHKSITSYSIALLTLFCCYSCNTYKVYYGTTATSLNHQSIDKTYRLDLSHQNLNKLPDNIKQQVHLKMLNLSGNTSLNLANALTAIPNPDQLQVLLLDSLNIKQLPQEITRFKNLKQLSLNGNPTIDLKTSLAILKGVPLEFINLQHNNLSKIPDHIQKITTLKHLNLSHNNFTGSSHFKTLSKLPKLTSLWLTNNKIQTLSHEITALKQLRNLYLEHNQLQTLPKDIHHLPKVWKIYLGHNAFTTLPIQILKMKSLLLLHINNNEITTIPEQFCTTKYSLKGIILNQNKLSKSDIARWKKELDNFFLASFE